MHILALFLTLLLTIASCHEDDIQCDDIQCNDVNADFSCPVAEGSSVKAIVKLSPLEESWIGKEKIFFIESSGRPFLKQRQACAVGASINNTNQSTLHTNFSLSISVQ
jgi:hypothetical protein